MLHRKTTSPGKARRFMVLHRSRSSPYWLHDGFRQRDTRAAGAIAVLRRMMTRYPIISRLECPDHFVDRPTLVDAGFVETPVREYDPSPVLGGCSQRSHRPDGAEKPAFAGTCSITKPSRNRRITVNCPL
jgi:hypothetical protein